MSSASASFGVTTIVADATLTVFRVDELLREGIFLVRIWLPAVLLIAMWIAVITIFLTPEPRNGAGVPHDRIAKMDQGGDGSQRHSAVFFAACCFGVCLITGFVMLVALDNVGREPRSAWWFVAGGVLYVAVFVAMCLAYRRAMLDPQTASFIGPFPAATSWLVFGMWTVPGVLILWYIAFFNRRVWPESRAKQFQRLVSSSRQRPPAG